MACLQALALEPRNGELWNDLGTSLFFAGEAQESELVYAEGLTHAPDFAPLRKEAEHARIYPAVSPRLQPLVDGFTDADFERVVLPEGSFSLKIESEISAGAV